MQADYETKSHAILSTLSSPSGAIDLWQLREFGLTSGGFLSERIRRTAWPKLLGLNKFSADGGGVPSRRSLTEKQRDQIDRDVERSLWHFESDFLVSSNSSNKTKKRKRAKKVKNKQKILHDVICDVLQMDSSLHYYQGYHDVASIFITTMSDQALATNVLGELSQQNFRDAMGSDFSTLTAALQLSIFPLVEKFDTELHDFIKKSGVEPYFALSWVS